MKAILNRFLKWLFPWYNPFFPLKLKKGDIIELTTKAGKKRRGIEEDMVIENLEHYKRVITGIDYGK